MSIQLKNHCKELVNVATRVFEAKIESFLEDCDCNEREFAKNEKRKYNLPINKELLLKLYRSIIDEDENAFVQDCTEELELELGLELEKQ